MIYAKYPNFAWINIFQLEIGIFKDDVFITKAPSVICVLIMTIGE